MSNPLSRDARDAMRALADKATPGPWTVCESTMSNQKLALLIGCTARDERDEPLYVAGLVKGDQDERDAEFIAAARSDVPLLLDEIECLEARIAERDAALRSAGYVMVNAVLRVDRYCTPLARAERAEALEAERDALRAALADLVRNAQTFATFNVTSEMHPLLSEQFTENIAAARRLLAPTPGVEESPE